MTVRFRKQPGINLFFRPLNHLPGLFHHIVIPGQGPYKLQVIFPVCPGDFCFKRLDVGLEVSPQPANQLIHGQWRILSGVDFNDKPFGGKASQHIVNPGSGNAGKFAELGSVGRMIRHQGHVAGRLVLGKSQISELCFVFHVLTRCHV